MHPYIENYSTVIFYENYNKKAINDEKSFAAGYHGKIIYYWCTNYDSCKNICSFLKKTVERKYY
jgi:hypothetical protein